jgi:hypothetical protein
MKKIKFLFFIFSILCDEVKSNANESLKEACEKIPNPTRANDCVIATLEWNYRCCYVYVKEGKTISNKSCKYFEDNGSKIKLYAKTVREEQNLNYKINCEGNFMNKNVFMNFLILLLIL